MKYYMSYSGLGLADLAALPLIRLRYGAIEISFDWLIDW